MDITTDIIFPIIVIFLMAMVVGSLMGLNFSKHTPYSLSGCTTRCVAGGFFVALFAWPIVLILNPSGMLGTLFIIIIAATIGSTFSLIIQSGKGQGPSNKQQRADENDWQGPLK